MTIHSEAQGESPLRRLEFWLLVALVFFLPLYEAPKNILWVAYVGSWLTNRWRSRTWGGRWDAWDTLIAAWIASGYFVAAFAATHDSEWGGATDVLRYASLLWCVRRSGYVPRQLAALGGMLLLSCAVALGWGFWRYYVTLQRSYVELHSVGHVNHSAPYLAICAAFALAWLFASWRRWGAALRVLTVLAAAFILAGLIIGSSRGAVGAMAVAMPVLGAAWWKRSRVPLFAIAIAMTIGIAAAVTFNIAVVEKQRAGMKAGDNLSQRGTIWRRAVVAWQANPWFGVGIDNFGMINDDMLRRQVESSGKTYIPHEYRGPNHAHSLYLNTLAERGLFGSVIAGAALAAWAITLWRRRPSPEAPDIVWTYWGSAVSAEVVILGAGIFNTTLHHEIAILAMLVLGGWMAAERSSARPLPQGPQSA